MRKALKTLMPLLSLILLATIAANAQEQSQNQEQEQGTISSSEAPPQLPDYEQPPCPSDGYLWQPGYWAYDQANGYYWVPGVWVAPPQPDMLWTPAFWALENGIFMFHAGYWGPTVGFYGGIDYGYGYSGAGYTGGVWLGHSFRYNTAVVNVNTTIVTHTYVDRTVIVDHVVVNRVSFNGRGGIIARPRAEELAAMHEHHIFATREQLAHQQVARLDRNQFVRVNRGHPNMVAMNRIGGESVHEGPRNIINRPGSEGYRPLSNGYHPEPGRPRLGEHADPVHPEPGRPGEPRPGEPRRDAPDHFAGRADAMHPEPGRPGEPRPGEPRPGEPRPDGNHFAGRPDAHPEPGRPGEPAHPGESRPGEPDHRVDANRPPEGNHFGNDPGRTNAGAYHPAGPVPGSGKPLSDPTHVGYMTNRPGGASPTAATPLNNGVVRSNPVSAPRPAGGTMPGLPAGYGNRTSPSSSPSPPTYSRSGNSAPSGSSAYTPRPTSASTPTAAPVSRPAPTVPVSRPTVTPVAKPAPVSRSNTKKG